MRSRLLLTPLLVSALLTGCQTVTTKENTATVDTTHPAPKPKNQATTAESKQAPNSSSKVKQPVSNNLWDITRDNFTLNDEAQHDAVTIQINWYKKYPRHMRRVTENASRYYHYVLNEVLKRDLPAEIALLPAVESMYDPDAYSSGHAVGIWQFIPSTAKYLGIKRSQWYDGRKDIIDSTKTALDYLEKLNQRFDGDWLLTFAAYNAGGGTISKAMRKNREAGLPTDYWSLSLPKETRLYVPRILALASFVRTPEAFDMHLPAIPNEPYFKVVSTSQQLSIPEAAKLAKTRRAELELLNPGLLELMTDPTGPHRLLIPAKKAETFKLALLEKPTHSPTQWVRYKVRTGDSLSALAARFGTKVKDIQEANEMTSSHLRVGKSLLIPETTSLAKANLAASSNLAASTTEISQYRVKQGDTLWRIANQYGIAVATLARWNNMQPADPIKIGEQLRIGELPSLARDEADALRRIGYRVQSGDSLSVIADRYNIRVADIREWNNLSGNNMIKAGQQLTLFIDEG